MEDKQNRDMQSSNTECVSSSMINQHVACNNYATESQFNAIKSYYNNPRVRSICGQDKFVILSGIVQYGGRNEGLFQRLESLLVLLLP